MTTTHAVRCEAFGGPEVLALREVPVPAPRRGEVRVRVEASGVAYGDVMRRNGVLAPKLPFTPGYDVAGVVDQLGKGVSGRWAAARVVAMMPSVGVGGYARHVVLPAKQLVRVPERVELDVAVALGLSYLTAYQLLRMAMLRAGDEILVHGAAGGVGTALLQLARHRGVLAHGTASAGKHELVRELGGDPIDYEHEDFVEVMKTRTRGRGVVAVFDGIGGDHLKRSFTVLSPGGTLVWYGVTGAPSWRAMADTLRHLLPLAMRRSRKVVPYAITVSPGARPTQCRADWGTLLDMHANGLEPVIGARLPLADASEAHRRLEAREVSGKIILVA